MITGERDKRGQVRTDINKFNEGKFNYHPIRNYDIMQTFKLKGTDYQIVDWIKKQSLTAYKKSTLNIKTQRS